MDAGMDKELIARRLTEESREKGISCAAALAMAKEFGVPPRRIGKEASRLGIKIRSCQLGCF
jgi:hypothetical protein